MKRSRILFLAFVPSVLMAGGAGALWGIDEPGLNATSSVDDQPIYVEDSVEVKRQETRDMTVAGLDSFVVMDPGIVSVTRSQGSDKVLIQGLAYGETFLHLWTRDGRKTIRITVVSKLKEDSNAEKKKASATQVSHRFSSNFQESRDENGRTSSVSRGYSYAMDMSGKTPFGQSQTRLNAEDYNDKKRLSNLQTTFKNKAGEFQAGDNYSRFSKLTVPDMGYQGIGWTSPKNSKLGVAFSGGYLNRQLWGNYVGYSDAAAPFVGLKTSFKATDHFEVFGVGSKGFMNDHPERSENKGFGASYKRSRIAVETEKAYSAAGGEAWYGDVEYKAGPAHLLYDRRDVGADYVSAAGNVSGQGEKGHRFGAGLVDVGSVSRLELSYDTFRKSYDFNPDNPDALNRTFRQNMEITKGKTSIVQEYFNSDSPGTRPSLQQNLLKFRVSQAFEKAVPSLSFRTERQSYFLGTSHDFLENGIGYGLSVRPLSGLSVICSMESVFAKDLNSGDKRNYTNLNAGVEFFNSLGIRNLMNNFRVEYRDVTYTRYQERSRQLEAQVKADYRLGGNLQIFAHGRFSNQFTDTGSNQAFSINTGVQFGNSLSLFGMRSQKVVGYVFKDLNGDGIKQENEPGLPGMHVNLNNSRSTVSGQDGRFWFWPKKGELTVTLDVKDLPAGMRVSSTNPQVFPESADGGTVRAWFGVAYLGDVTGGVYIDSNGDGLLDAADMPVKNAVVSMENGKVESTERDGKFALRGIPPGEHFVRLDMMTLRENMVPVSPTYNEFKLEEGGKREFVFLIRPVRYFSGMVYWDKNGNGFMDPDETPVEGIRLFAGTSEVSTDAKGEFFLKGFQTGTVILNVDSEALKAKGWRIEKGLPQEYDVPANSPFIQKSMTIAVEKAQ